MTHSLYYNDVQHDGGLASIAVVQQDEDLEAVAGRIQLLWLYTDTMVEGDSWTQGQVAVRADTVDDVVQNYTVNTPYQPVIGGVLVRVYMKETIFWLIYVLTVCTFQNHENTDKLHVEE